MYLIYGFGISNRSLSHYLLGKGIDFCIWDDSQVVLNEIKELGYKIFNQEDLAKVSLAVISPGVSRNLSNHIVAKCIQMNIKITNDVGMFLSLSSGFKIGVTGSFGKSTCVALFKHIYDCFLKKNDRCELSSFQIAGNFGIPCFDCSTTEATIFELSAQQLDVCPPPELEIAMILNLYNQHLDDFGTFERYFIAKEKILQKSKIKLIGDGVPKVPGAKIISSNTIDADYSFVDRKIYENGIHVEDIKTRLAPDSVIGAYALARELNLPSALVVNSIESFSGLEHRCEFIRISTSKASSFDLLINNSQRIAVNDSKSTNISNTLHCLLSLRELPKVALICGGKFVEQDLTQLDKVIDKISFVGCIGSSSEVLRDYFITKKIPIFIGSLLECIENCYKINLPIIFSPGYASSDQYKNFVERGEEFKK